MMARAGVYKNDVFRARQALLARGEKPSIRAVRVALGNTGSDSTIHKYLREIEEEEGDNQPPKKMALSEVISSFVAGLALELEQQGKFQVDAAIETFRQREEDNSMKLSSLQAKNSDIETALTSEQKKLIEEKSLHSETCRKLSAQIAQCAGLEAQVAELRARDIERDIQLRSAMKNAEHSRESLEHYREAMKQQRDQEKRSAEQLLAEVRLQLRNLTTENQKFGMQVKKAETESIENMLACERERRALENAQRALAQANEDFLLAETHRITLLEEAKQQQTLAARAATEIDILRRNNLELTALAKKAESALVAISAQMSAQEELLAPVKAYFYDGVRTASRRKRQI